MGCKRVDKRMRDEEKRKIKRVCRWGRRWKFGVYYGLRNDCGIGSVLVYFWNM